MESNCDTSCNLAVCLLGLLIIIMALRYYYLHRPLAPRESFISELSNNNSNNNNLSNNNNNNLSNNNNNNLSNNNNNNLSNNNNNNLSNNNNNNLSNNNNNNLNINNIKDEPNTYYPCSPENFKKSLYEFYKSAENYRTLETELQEAQLQYEKKYDKFLKQHKNLSYHKERISQCVNDAN